MGAEFITGAIKIAKRLAWLAGRKRGNLGKVRRIEIRIRTRQTLELAVGAERCVGCDDALRLRWCAECGQLRWMITPESAATLADVETPTLYQWAYSGRVHSVEEVPDRLFICLSSLPF